MNEEYCEKCGCPKDICCGQNKVSLEWLEDEFDKYEGISINNFKRRIMKVAKIQAGEK
jgi:hypothetical protein